jgi:hypothetical protein
VRVSTKARSRTPEWVPTAREKECSRALAIDIEEWPAWLAERYRRLSLRDIQSLLAGYKVSVSYTWLSTELAKFDIPTVKRPAGEGAR